MSSEQSRSGERPAISANDLGKCYQIYDRPSDRLKQTLFRGRRQFYREFWALRGVSLEVRRGESLGIIGRNGSGKSTLLQLLAGTLAPTTGNVEVHGRVAALLELGAGFNPEFTGRENVHMNGAILGISREEMARRFDDIARFAEIGSFIDQPTKTYSSGMLIRLAFSVAINVDPDILIVDEALAVGDAAFQFKCLERLNTITRSGVTLLFVSHSMEMVRSFCSDCLYLDGGVAKARGTPDEITERYLFDVRTEQQKARGATSPLLWKTPLYGSGPAAFGSEDARIVSAVFDQQGGQTGSFTADEQIAIVIEAEYRQSVEHPHLAVVLQDWRMMQIAGRFFPIEGAPAQDGMRRVRVLCAFPARFASGRYFVTLRLEDRNADGMFFPHDKQTGVMSFEVLRPQRDILGAVDLPFVVRELPLQEPDGMTASATQHAQ